MRLIAITLALILLPLAGCTASGGDATPRTLSFDGLTPVDGTIMQQVWVREGFSLAGYRKVILDSAAIQFRPVTRKTPAGLASAAVPFPLDAAQRAEISRLITREFDRALNRLTLERVTEPGPDVLRVRGSMLDVAVRAPAGGSEARYDLEPIGQLTFVVELIDSQTNTVLVRALDTRAPQIPGRDYPSSTASDRKAAAALIGRWADMLVDALNDLTRIDQLQGAQT
ncbi:MAG: DUF3313 family protein [Pseudomonadales bacterium]|jgi:hypothetical protein